MQVTYLVKYSSPASCHFTLLDQNILLSTLFSNTNNLCCHLVWQTKYHTHINQEVKLEFIF